MQNGINGLNGLNGISGINGMNVLQAAALATQAALQNPALQPILMAQAANPWLSHNLPYGLINPTSALTGAQLGHISSMPAAPVVPNPAAGVAQSASASPMLDATLLASQLPLDPAAATNPLLFYQNQAQDWQRAAVAAASVDPRGLSMSLGTGWTEQLAAAARNRAAGFSSTAAFSGTATAI